jgi:zinc protease
MRILHPSAFALFVTLLITTQSSCSRLHSRSDSGATASPSPEQSKVDEILGRYETAVGGKEAIDRLTSYRMKGTFELSVLGEPGKLEVWGKDPDKTLAVIKFPRIGTLKKGFDGQTRWVQTPAGTYTDSSPQEIAEMERDSEVYSASRIRSSFESMKLESRARLSGREMYVVEGKPPKGPAEKLFFDVENGLLVRWDMARRQPERGIVFVKVHLNDYKEVDGVKVPFNLRFSFESFSFTVKIDELEHNLVINDAFFKKP